jgi:DNA modification methylase
MQWLMWDKGQREFSLADFEMAWSSQNKAARAFSYPRSRALRDGKEHPTQKPVEVMAWCLDQLPPGTKTIVDPFAGVFTTGVAAVNRGLSFTGIEREEKYFEAGLRRISDAIKRPRLPFEEPRKAVQEALDL